MLDNDVTDYEHYKALKYMFALAHLRQQPVADVNDPRDVLVTRLSETQLANLVKGLVGRLAIQDS